MTDRIIFAFDRKTARSFDADGRMRVKNCILSTAEINPYYGKEIPDKNGKLGLNPNTVYELYRDPEEMRKAVATFEGIPLMIKHIPQTAEEPRKEYQAGAVHSITFDGKHLRGDLLVSDGRAIDLIESDELSDLSCGYRYDPVMQSGEADGSKYDGRMTNLQGNHVALVDDGRASGAHVADSALRNPQSPDPSMQQGAIDMAFPEKDGAAPTPKTPAGETAAGAEPAPAAGAAPAAAAPAEPAGEQVNMAAIGQALKHIATLLESLHGKMGAADEMNPAAQEAHPLNAAAAGANDEEHEGEGVDPERRQAEDFNLEPAVEGKHAGAMDGEDGVNHVLREDQEGTGARGEKTPHGAMDAKSVQALVQRGVLQERARAAAVATAQREVRGVLGDVYGMDSAGAIYREALKHVGVDVAQLPKGAEKAAWQGYKVAAQAAAGVRPRSEMALDNASVERTQNGILGHLAKIAVKG